MAYITKRSGTLPPETATNLRRAQKRYETQRTKFEQALKDRDAAVLEAFEAGAEKLVIARTLGVDEKMIRKLLLKLEKER